MAGNLRRGLLAPSARGDDDLLGNEKWSRADVLRYGSLVQAAYDAFGKSTGAARCVGCRLLLPGSILGGTGYVATAAIYSTIDIVPGNAFDDRRRRWIGYVAVAAERDAAGYRDIVVVWRGTMGWLELFKVCEVSLVPIHGGDGARRITLPTPLSLRVALAVQTAWDAVKALVAAWCLRASSGDAGMERGKLRERRHVEDELRLLGTCLSVGQAPAMFRAWDASKARVADGFHSFYITRCDGQARAQSQVLDELRRLVQHFRTEHPDEKVRVTVTGHSLGGALSLLTARDAAGDSELSAAAGGVPVRVVTFGCPRVGNRAFRDELLKSRGVSILRVAIKQDIVTWLPPALMGYVHAGDEYLIDADLRRVTGIFHSLDDTYMPRLRGGENPAGGIRWDMDSCQMPVPEPGKEIQSPLELSKLDEIIYSKKTKTPFGTGALGC